MVPHSRLLGSSLVCAYRGLGGHLGTTARSVRPGYFDWPWRSIAVSIPVDPVSCHDFRSSDDPDRVCTGFLAQHYPGYDVIFTDGVVDPVSGRVGCGFYVAGDNFRYGLSLQPFTSVLSAELYAILRAVHYAGRSAISRVTGAYCLGTRWENVTTSTGSLMHWGVCVCSSWTLHRCWRRAALPGPIWDEDLAKQALLKA